MRVQMNYCTSLRSRVVESCMQCQFLGRFVALDVSPDRKTLYVHVMYMDTPDAAREEIKKGFERRVLEVLG